MLPAKTAPGRKLRTLLILGRVSNLPTIWSNCLAGWLLGGGGSLLGFVVLGLGATCIYVGGMYLNDAFDANFDRQHRQERPIPAGAISRREVWAWGFFWLAIGAMGLFTMGRSTVILTVLLIGAILLYDAVHKMIAFSPVLMAFCRFVLYLVAASTAQHGVTGLALWSALVLAAYVVGLSSLARKESVHGVLHAWPCYLLGAPILLALVANAGTYWNRAVLLAVIFSLWVLRCLRHTFWSSAPQVGRTVSGLLAGIVLVDLLAVAGGTLFSGLLLLLLFAAALVFQRFIPAT